jgi:hypothetical protein
MDLQILQIKDCIELYRENWKEYVDRMRSTDKITKNKTK